MYTCTTYEYYNRAGFFIYHIQNNCDYSDQEAIDPFIAKVRNITLEWYFVLENGS